MQELKNKTILMLAPKFFGYELEIKKELGNLGAKVIYYDERPKNNFLTKVCIRLNFKLPIKMKINRYYKKIKDEIASMQFDYLFLLNVETVPINFVKKLINDNLEIKVLTYFWDSINNRKQSLKYLQYSDCFFSFDFRDITLDSKIKFLPLFYIKDYQTIANRSTDLVYDVSFIGTIHSDRYKIIKKFEKQLMDFNLTSNFYFYSPSKILFFFQKIFKKEFRTIQWNDISFKSLDKLDVLNIISKSKCIIDIQHPLQTGLTMRTIEMLGANRKLLTTNKEIETYDFYNENNIFIFDRSDPTIALDFINLTYEKVDQKIYEKYSLVYWLKTIFQDFK